TGAGVAPPGPGAPDRGGSPPRPGRARGCSRRGAPRRSRGSQPLAHPRGEDVQLIAVLGDGATGDLDAPFGELLDDLLAGQRVFLMLVPDQLLHLWLYGPGAPILAGGGRAAGREEEL